MNKEVFGLDGGTRSRLLDRLTGRRPEPAREAGREAGREVPGASPPRPARLGPEEQHESLRLMRQASTMLGIPDPFFRPHDGIAADTTSVGGAALRNFSSYNYLGLNGDPRVSAAAKAAIDRYGTSVSASRIVSGERPIHRELETALAAVHGTEDAVVMVSGHATNVTTIAALLGAGDLVVHDSLSHNSIVQGAILSGAHRASFPHNDLSGLDGLLTTLRPRFKQALIVVEGHYSMDGDVPDLAGLVRVARRHGAAIMVDEAHGLGVLGPRGHGIAEHAGVDPTEIDLWMGTLSKSLAGCGGYVAGRRETVELLKFHAPGFVYSVGMPPPVAAAALEALRLMLAEPERVARLQRNGARFLERARAAGLDTGPSIGAAIVPVIVGSSIRAARLSDTLFRRGVNVQPIMHPAVPERAARLRFFISADHEEAAIDETVAVTAEELGRIGSERVSTALLKAQLR